MKEFFLIMLSYLSQRKVLLVCHFQTSIDNLESEIPQTGFPLYKPQLVKLLTECRKTVALTGDKFGRANVIEHQLALKKGIKPFFLPNYCSP